MTGDLNTTFGYRRLQESVLGGGAVNRLLEMHFPTLFHTASALSAPSGHLPLEGKANYIKRRSRHCNPEPRTSNLEPRTPNLLFFVAFLHTYMLKLDIIQNYQSMG